MHFIRVCKDEFLVFSFVKRRFLLLPSLGLVVAYFENFPKRVNH